MVDFSHYRKKLLEKLKGNKKKTTDEKKPQQPAPNESAKNAHNSLDNIKTTSHILDQTKKQLSGKLATVSEPDVNPEQPEQPQQPHINSTNMQFSQNTTKSKPVLKPPSPPKPQQELKQTSSSEDEPVVHPIENTIYNEESDNLDSITDDPLQAHPTDLRFRQIAETIKKNNLHNEQSSQENWSYKTICPLCESSKIKTLTQAEQTPPHHYPYLCLDCDCLFGDETEVPFMQEMPPLTTWLQCWYLIGCTTSRTYIAAKLGLELDILDKMIRKLQKIFKSEKPETSFKNFEEWSKHDSHLYEKKIQEEIISKKQILLTGESTTSPQDTAEYRRQYNRRRNPTNKNQ